MSTTTGERIKAQRKALGISKDELARKLGYQSRSSVNKIESGERDLPQSKIKAIADALCVSTSFIMGWEEKPAYVVLSPKAQKFAAAFDKATAKEQQIIQLMLSEYLDDEKASWDFTEFLPIP